MSKRSKAMLIGRSDREAVRRTILLVIALIVLIFSSSGVGQTWPRCISGCTANDVELIGVTAEILGSCAPGGTVDAVLRASLRFNRSKTYCVRFVTDVYIDGDLAMKDLVTEPFNVLTKGTYSDVYLGTVSLPCGSAMTLSNVQIMWSVNNKLDPVSMCRSGACTDYGPGSKCTGDQYESYPVTLPLDAVDDDATTSEETPIDVLVLSNDLLGLPPTSIIRVTDGVHGTVIRNVDETITYTPDPEFDGSDSFTYTIADAHGTTDSATVTVVVLPVNDPPIATDDDAPTDENDFVNIDLTANDVDPDGAIDPTTVTIVDGPRFGTLDVDPATGIVTYAPNPGACGSDRFTYRVYDFDEAVSNEATVTLDVICNLPPSAGDDAASTDENTSVGISVLANDADSDGTIDASSVRITSPPSIGHLSVHPSTGVVTYTPDPAACGSDSFRYTVDDDDHATSDEARVMIDVMCDDPPLAIDDLYTANEGETHRVEEPGILANDVTSPWEPLSAILVSDVSHGTLMLDPAGSFVYVHDGTETTSDSFTYYAFDGTDDSNVAVVNLVVSPTNDPPTASDDEASTGEDEPVTIPVLANDSDPDRDPLDVDWVEAPQHGTAINGGTDLTYIPAPDAHGVETFTYGVSDGHGGSATATVTVTVNERNDPPIAQDDSAQTREDVPIEIAVLTNDRDPDEDPLDVHSVGSPANGTAATQGDRVTYVPDPGFHGADAFSYTIADGRGGTSTATVSITVVSVNDPPNAEDDATEGAEDESVRIDVLRNDKDPDGDALTIEAVTQPSRGTVVNNGSDIDFTPNPNVYGSDTFTYTISDGRGGTDTATVTVLVSSSNDPPIAQDDTAGTSEETPVTIPVLANDSDPDGDDLAVSSITQPANGSAIKQGNEIVYTPDPGYYGSDVFSYTLSDGNEGTDSANVMITIGAVNDRPTANDDVTSTDEDVSVVIGVLGNDSDPDGDDLVVQSVVQPANGSVANNGVDVTYAPDPDFHGTEAFTYTVSDRNGGTDSAEVTVTVVPKNDPPNAQNDSAGTDEGLPVTIDVLDNDSDPDGDDLIIQSVAQPLYGSAIGDGRSIVYTPEPGSHGIVTFTYDISDENGGTDTAVVTVAVALVNDSPNAADDESSTFEDTPTTISVLPNDSDPDGDTLTIQSVTRPAHGTAVPSGTSIVYTPLPGYAGSDSFSYTVSDGSGGTDSAIVTLTVLPINDPPIAQNDNQTTAENRPVAITVLSNDVDPDGDALLIQSVVQPPNGTVVANDAELLYTPDPGFSGIDSFVYTVTDGRGESDSARVTIAVATVNDPPIAQDDVATTDEGKLVDIAVLKNDTDPDGDFLLVETFTQPRNGSVLNTRTGISYVPDPEYHGVDTFAYTVSDGNGGIDSATVTVSVAATNAAPTATDDSASTDEGVAVVIPVLLNDDDPDGDPLIVQAVGSAEHGTLVNLGPAVEYVPNEEFNGVDQFVYTISDGNGGADTANVFVAVAGVNDRPTAQNDSGTTEWDTSISIPVLANDEDPDGDTILIASVTPPTNGTVRIDGGALIYTPVSGFAGNETFTYTISDGRGASDEATVTIGVLVGGRGGATDAMSCEGRVIINEIAWAGTAADPRDEWIELRNLGTSRIDLAGWTLRWRPTHPTTSEEQVWRTVELIGFLEGAEHAACDPTAEQQPGSSIHIEMGAPESFAWAVIGAPSAQEAGYYTLERRRDDTIADARADLVYDAAASLGLALSDSGDVLMLIDPSGNIVDTANASNLGRSGWAAGAVDTYGTMERTDPLAPDVSENWHTNLGIVSGGTDADGRPLRATPGAENSPVLEGLDEYGQIEPTAVIRGVVPQLRFDLTRQDRRETGWPWISVTRPGFAGEGGTLDVTRFSFAGRHEGSNEYVLDIRTENLSFGSYTFLIIHGDGQGLLVPLIVTP